MTTADKVLYQVHAGVATVTLNDPAQANAIGLEMCAGLAGALAAAAADPQVNVVVLAGAGPAFSAGGDLDLMRQFLDADPAAVTETLARSLDVVDRLYRLRKPTVARVQGPAVGGGAALALACDFVVAAEAASFRFAWIHLGLVPDLGALYLLPRLVGPRRARELCYLGQAVTAGEALALGLVNRVVPAAELDARVAALAGDLRDRPAGALALAKTILQRGLDADLQTVLELECGAQTLLWKSAGTRRAVEQMAARIKGSAD